MKIISNLNEFIEKIDNIKKVNPLDLSSDQDLSIAIMNLISIEEHLFFSGAKTQDNSFYEMILPVREYRKELLKRIVKTYKGEVWCISKHLLAGSMRLMEVGTKALAAGKKDDAYALFETSYNLYCLFWGLNVNSISEAEAKDIIKNLNPETLAHIAKDTELPPPSDNEPVAAVAVAAPGAGNTNTAGMMAKLKSVVSKVLDCCRE